MEEARKDMDGLDDADRVERRGEGEAPSES